tara:strand:- start:2684 stop:2932 length:249 start_codon:yes stop_codon:yes gene_type:complete
VPQNNITLDDLMGVNEVAAFLQVTPNLVSAWIKRSIMPLPDTTLNAGRTLVWTRETIENWATATGKMPMNRTPVWVKPKKGK